MCRAPSVATSEGWLPALEREYPRSIPRAIAAALPGTPVRRASRWNRTLFFHLGPSLTRSSVFSSSSNSKGNEGRCTPLWQNFSRVRRLIIPIHPHPRGTRLTSRRATRAPPTLNITRMTSPRVSSARSALTPLPPLRPPSSQCMSTADSPTECANLREDYFECLHHRKEIRRSNTVMEQRSKTINEKAEVLKEQIWKQVFDTSWAKVEKAK